jgi:uroporphyrinogen decarboxylase
MDKCERVFAALEGKPVDRVPLSLWRHFHKQDQSPAGLASATLAYYRKYNFDLIKLTPSGLYPIEDWGAQIAHSKDDDHPPRLKKPVVKDPDEWRELSTLNPTEGTLGALLEATKLLTDLLDRSDAPVLMTIFSPMTIAYKLAGDALLEHLQTHPTDVQIGLATIAETTSRFAMAALDAGAGGIFFASQFSRADLITPKMCMDFVVRYDLIALGRVKTEPVPLILHLHGENIFFDTVNHYPAHAISWHNHETGPSLAEALALTDKTLITGLGLTQLEKGQPDEIVAQAGEAIKTTNGRRLILAPACVIPTTTPPANLEAIAAMNRSISVSDSALGN